MPAQVNNRQADNWRPLISIADSLGWGKQARKSLLKFAAEFQDADVRISLLTDIRQALDARGIDRIATKALLSELHALDDSDWNEFRGIRGDQQPHRLKDSELASMLRDFKIRSRTIWPLHRSANSKSMKGYLRAQFEEAWRAYCSEDGTASHANENKYLRLAE